MRKNKRVLWTEAELQSWDPDAAAQFAPSRPPCSCGCCRQILPAVPEPSAAARPKQKAWKIPEHDLLKLSEAAGCLRCSERSILRLLQEGRIEGFRLREGSSRWLIDRASFLRFCTERKEASANS